SGGYGPVQNPQKRKEPLHEPRAKAGASSTHSKRCRAVAERLGLREAFGVRPACRRFPIPRFFAEEHVRLERGAARGLSKSIALSAFLVVLRLIAQSGELTGPLPP